MNIKYLLCFPFFCSFIISCAHNDSNDFFSLVRSDVEINFPLDTDTKSFILALFPYEDENGNDYLTFQNQGRNEILFYNMETGKLEFKVKPEVSGSNGVGFFIGYHVRSLDSIFLTIQGLEEIALINRDAIVKDKYQYEYTKDSISLRPYYSMSSYYHPIVFLGNQMYILPGCNRWAEHNPVCATIDIDNKQVKALGSFSYPFFPGADNKAKRASAEGYVSRIFDGEQFIYSFYFDENIYVVSTAHDAVKKIRIKSKFIDKIKMLDDYGNLTHEDGCKNPNYGNLIFDKYRDVYYRIAYPETELETGVKGRELLEYGRKYFSIIILNKKFEIIGETLFPDYTYNSTLMFVRKDGLYISDSHYMNPSYSDDVLSFRKFDLVKK